MSTGRPWGDGRQQAWGVTARGRSPTAPYPHPSQPRLSPQLAAVLASGVPMASLSRALRVATTRPRWSPARGPGLRPVTSGAGPTTEKSVPYQRTLKEAQGPSAAAQGPSRPLPSTADVVVIGGGSLGCQTLYHLAKLGVSTAVLLERERLTSGTTWHTAGRAGGAGSGLAAAGLVEAAERRGRTRRKDAGSGGSGQTGSLLVPKSPESCGGRRE